MLTKLIVNGMISVLADGQIQWRQDTIIDEDGVELSRTYFRTVLPPSNDTSSITDPIVKSVAELIWTPDVVNKYKESVSTSPV